MLKHNNMLINMNNDCLLYVFGFLSLGDLINCSYVCARFYKLTKNEMIWTSHFVKDFHNIVCINNFYDNYKECYVFNKFLKKHKREHINIMFFMLGPRQNNSFSKQYTQKLFLNSNCLKIIPGAIGKLTYLQVLDLSNNSLKSLPKEIGLLINLRILHLYTNKLKTLPPEIGKLTLLKDLYIFDNKLRTIPQELIKCMSLQCLLLDKKQLPLVPKNMNKNVIKLF